MGGQVLVALKGDDRLEQIIPYIEKIARPGMRVVYLMRCPMIGASKSVQDRRMSEFLDERSSVQRNILERNSGEEHQIRLVQLKVFLAQEALRTQGVESIVDVYAGPLRKVVERYMRKGDVKFILTRNQGALRSLGFLQGMMSLFGLFKQPILFPMLLIHPGSLL
jgi:hypothetical protein